MSDHNFIGNVEANKPYVNYWKHVAKCLICKHQKYCSVHVHDTFVRVVVLIQVYNSQYNGKCLKILEVVQAIVMYINMLFNLEVSLASIIDPNLQLPESVLSVVTRGLLVPISFLAIKGQ